MFNERLSMKPRTLEESIERENQFRTTLIPLGWKHNGNWMFSKDGKEYDFSATSLDYILMSL